MNDRATGTRGSWFAEVGGELLPCVHEYWYKPPVYDDPHAILGDKKWDELADAISRLKRVVLTKDEPIDGGLGFNRTGYIAEFEISDFKYGDGHLQFRMVRRLRNLK